MQDVKKDYSDAQLSALGAVIVAWNEVEFMLDVALYSGESLPADCLTDDLNRRFLDKKIQDLRRAASKWKLPQQCVEAVSETAEAFSRLKDRRNAVAHSRIFNNRLGIAERVTKKNDIEEVLVTHNALEWLYNQLVGLRDELRAVLAIFDLVRTTELAEQSGLVAKGTIDPIPEVNEWLVKLLRSRQRRAQFGPEPGFPGLA